MPGYVCLVVSVRGNIIWSSRWFIFTHCLLGGLNPQMWITRQSGWCCIIFPKTCCLFLSLDYGRYTSCQIVTSKIPLSVKNNISLELIPRNSGKTCEMYGNNLPEHCNNLPEHWQHPARALATTCRSTGNTWMEHWNNYHLAAELPLPHLSRSALINAHGSVYHTFLPYSANYKHSDRRHYLKNASDQNTWVTLDNCRYRIIYPK